MRLHAVHDLRLYHPLRHLPRWGGHHVPHDDAASEDDFEVGVGEEVQQAVGPLRGLKHLWKETFEF